MPRAPDSPTPTEEPKFSFPRTRSCAIMTPPDMSDAIRVLIADDHLMFREGVNMILSGVEDMHVLVEAGIAAEAFRLARESGILETESSGGQR